MALVAFRLAAETGLSDDSVRAAEMPFMTHPNLWTERCKLKVSAANLFKQAITYLAWMYFQMYLQVS